MKREDFLISIFICVVCWRAYINGSTDFAFYALLFLLPMYSLMAWLKQIQINLLKHDCNVAGEEFSEKYKDLPPI
jgi:hypothetical protein